MRLLPLLAALLLAACGEAPVLITGDAAAVGARVLVDGREIGRLERKEDGTRVFASARLSAPRGERRVEVVAPDGRSLSAVVKVQGDVYLVADFAAGKLRD